MARADRRAAKSVPPNGILLRVAAPCWRGMTPGLACDLQARQVIQVTPKSSVFRMDRQAADRVTSNARVWGSQRPPLDGARQSASTSGLGSVGPAVDCVATDSCVGHSGGHNTSTRRMLLLTWSMVNIQYWHPRKQRAGWGGRLVSPRPFGPGLVTVTRCNPGACLLQQATTPCPRCSTRSPLFLEATNEISPM